MHSGNYSASEHYDRALRQYDQKAIPFKKIRKRWFRNFYMLHQSKGWFTHNSFVFSFEEIEKNPKAKNYTGEWYGPFWSQEEADSFGRGLCKTHTSFILGGC